MPNQSKHPGNRYKKSVAQPFAINGPESGLHGTPSEKACTFKQSLPYQIFFFPNQISHQIRPSQEPRAGSRRGMGYPDQSFDINEPQERKGTFARGSSTRTIK